jgi:hypothetical protein
VSTNRRAEQAGQDHADEVTALLRAVLESAGASDRATRESAYRGHALPPPLAEYVTKVRDASYRIGDADIVGLLTAGHSQDAIFEITVATALGAAARGLEAGLRAMRGEGADETRRA